MPKMNDAGALTCIAIWGLANAGLVWVLSSKTWLVRRLMPAFGAERGALIWLLLVALLGAGSLLFLWFGGLAAGGFLD